MNNYYVCIKRSMHSSDEEAFDSFGFDTLREAKGFRQELLEEGTSEKNCWIKISNGNLTLKDLFDEEKDFIVELPLNNDYYLFVEGLDKFGCSIIGTFDTKRIRKFCVELIDNDGEVVKGLISYDINLSIKLIALQTKGYQAIEEFKKESKEEQAKELSIATFMYFEGTKLTEYGNYSFDFDGLIEKLPHLNLTKQWLYDHYEDIVSILEEHPGVASVEEFDKIHHKNLYFDINFYGEFCGLTEEDGCYY